MLEGKGKFYVRELREGTIVADIHISSRLVRDSQFPFKHKDQLEIRVDPKNQTLIITKRGKNHPKTNGFRG
jgi:hypothetical protein